MKSLLVLMLLLSLPAESVQEQVIVWQPGSKLSWADFQGNPDGDISTAAITASGISFKLSTHSVGAEVKEYVAEVFAYFSPSKSWFRPKVVDAAVLGHEQLHFDITALYAEKLKLRLAGLQYTSDLGDRMTEEYKKILSELDSVQQLYDRQTENSVNGSSQALWESKIRGELKRILSE